MVQARRRIHLRSLLPQKSLAVKVPRFKSSSESSVSIRTWLRQTLPSSMCHRSKFRSWARRKTFKRVTGRLWLTTSCTKCLSSRLLQQVERSNKLLRLARCNRSKASTMQANRRLCLQEQLQLISMDLRSASSIRKLQMRESIPRATSSLASRSQIECIINSLKWGNRLIKSVLLLTTLVGPQKIPLWQRELGQQRG